ncbi:hypothetical protein EVAR_32998_1 [Eumeta japonica]|uniref:Uncharacterized protein n=1 Tax=Eumeta variegata TaxID=151549 RepID=A0A4C1VRH7_EUMVA|nr:hypothetical protein EVAR_32998_1 [Eumeta japonica]
MARIAFSRASRASFLLARCVRMLPQRVRAGACGSTKRPTFNGESTDRVAVETLYDSLAIAGDHKAHFDITVNGDFDQFDRNRSKSYHLVFCVLYIFASGSYQRALATGHCVSQQALSDSGYALKPWLLTPITGAPPGSREYQYTKDQTGSESSVTGIGVENETEIEIDIDRYKRRKIYSTSILVQLQALTIRPSHLQESAEQRQPGQLVG